MKQLYRLHDPPDVMTVIEELERIGDDAKIQAVLFVVMHFIPGFPSRLDVILMSHKINLELSKHPMIDMFTEDDLRWAWNYLLEHRYLRALAGH